MTDNLTTSTKPVLTMEETREILTPFAFKIDENLFGTPLAKSWKRGVAILIDLALIALLSNTSGEFLAFIVAVVFFRLGSKKRAQLMGKNHGGMRRALLRFCGAIILFLVLASIFPTLIEFINYSEQDESQKSVFTIDNEAESIGIADTLALVGLVTETVKLVNNSQCDNVECWQSVLVHVPTAMAKFKMPDDKAKDLTDDIVKEIKLAKTDKDELSNWLYQQYHLLKSDKKVNVEKPVDETTNDDTITSAMAAFDSLNNSDIDDALENETEVDNSLAIDETKPTKNNKNTKEKPTEFSYSIIDHTKAIIDDLGLGFGWAALYFTVFTSLWSGQTPGKKILGIQVIQLDGTPLSMMDSFGRYGGYGAGIATGLLGFLQIYWDPNRQAIHDKISSTVVVDYHAHVSKTLMKAVHDGEVTAAS